MVNPRIKGSRIQLKLIKDFEADGWRVAKLEQKGKYTKETDAYGLFDLLAIRKSCFPSLIQVTCNRPHTHKEYEVFAKEYGEELAVMQAVWYDRLGWKYFFYNRSGKKLVIDERKK